MSNILHTIPISAEVEIKIDLLHHVRKLLSYGRYSTQLSADGVNIAYASSPEIDADLNVSIVDRSNSILENCSAVTSKEETFVASSFSTRYKNFLITNVYTPTLTSQSAKPLYYKHTLPAETVLSSIQILDSNFQPINQYLYNTIVDRSNGDPNAAIEAVQVYNDLSNFFSDDTGELIVYFIKYRVGANTYIRLLNNQSAFREAGFDDIDWTSHEVYPGKKVYILNEIEDSYSISLPEEDTYSLRYIDQTRIRLLNSLADDPDQGWFPRVSYGSFITWDGSVKYTYGIPEFQTQQFNPFPPYKLVPYERVSKIGNGLIALEHTPTAIGELSLITLFLDLIIEDQNGNPLYALTTNSSKNRQTYEKNGISTSISWDSERILGYDNATGIVHIDLDIKDYHVIYATYYYEEKFLEITTLNLNPLMSDDVVDSMYVVYLVPKRSTEDTPYETSIEWLRVSSRGIVIEWSQDSLNDFFSEVVGEERVLRNISYGRPVPSSDPTSFLYNYSVEAKNPSTQEYTNDYRYLILGEITVNKISEISDIVTLDTRERGGGIKEDLLDEVINSHPEVQFYTDIGFGGGIPFPGQAVAVIRLPRTLLAIYGGRFKEEDIREIAHRHLAFGHYPLIRYYDPNEFIIEAIDGYNTDISRIYLKWRGTGTGWTASVDGTTFVSIDDYITSDSSFLYFCPNDQFTSADKIQIKNGNKYSNVIYLLIR